MNLTIAYSFSFYAGQWILGGETASDAGGENKKLNYDHKRLELFGQAYIFIPHWNVQIGEA